MTDRNRERAREWLLKGPVFIGVEDSLTALLDEVERKAEARLRCHNVRGSDGPCDCAGCRDVDEAQEKELSTLRQAVGLATTAVPTMEMDTEHPIEMMQQVVAWVEAQAKEIEKLKAEVASCDGHGYLREEIERLTNKLNADSQNFELECQKAEIERLRGLIVDWYDYFNTASDEDAEDLRGAVYELQSEGKSIREALPSRPSS
jgi:hypothetical protein